MNKQKQKNLNPHLMVRAGVFTLILLCCINLLNYIDRNLVAGILKDIGEQLLQDDFSRQSHDFYKGIIHYSLVFSYMIFAPIISYIIDKRGWRRKYIIIPGIMLWCVFTGLGGFVQNYEQLLLTRALVGIGEACFVATAPGLLADYFPIEKRGRVLMWFYMMGPMGVALAYIIAPNIAGMFGDWRYAFYLVGFPGMILAFLFFMVKEPARGASHDAYIKKVGNQQVGMQKGELKSLIHNKSYIFVTAGMTALTFAVWGMAWFVGEYFYELFFEAQDITGSLKAKAGNYIGITLLFGGMAGVLLGGFLADYFNKRDKRGYFWVSGIALFISAPLFVICMSMDNFYIFLVLVLVLQILWLINQAPTHAIILNVTVPSIRTFAFALNMFFMHALGDMISPPTIGGLSWFSQLQFGLDDLTGMYVGFMIVPVMLVAAGIFFWLGGPHYEKDVLQVDKRLEALSKAYTQSGR